MNSLQTGAYYSVLPTKIIHKDHPMQDYSKPIEVEGQQTNKNDSFRDVLMDKRSDIREMRNNHNGRVERERAYSLGNLHKITDGVLSS